MPGRSEELQLVHFEGTRCYVCDEPGDYFHFSPAPAPNQGLFIATAFCYHCLKFFHPGFLRMLVDESIHQESTRPMLDLVHLVGDRIEKRTVMNPTLGN